MSSRGGMNNRGDNEGGSNQPQPQPDPQKQSISPNVIRVTLLASLALLSCLFLYHSAYPLHDVFTASYNALPLVNNDATPEDKLSSHEKLASPTNLLNGGNSSLEGGNNNQKIETNGDPSSSTIIGNETSSSKVEISKNEVSNVEISKNEVSNNVEGSKNEVSNVDDSTKGKTSTISLDPSGGTEGSEEDAKQLKNLKKILKKAAMSENTVILTTLNKAWAAPNSVFDVFLKGFKNGDGTKKLLKHLIVIALDQTAYTRCKKLHHHCFTLTTKGLDFSAEALFMTDVYLKMMWRRIDFLRIVLELGYNFIFTDVDILWFRNPFLRFIPDADFQIACDHYKYDAADLNNELNGGFNFVKSNNRTVQFYRFFYKSKDNYPGKHDQDVLNIIKFDPYIKQLGIKIRFLSTAYYGGFCEPAKNLNEVITMHANCCIGLDHKVRGLKNLLKDWKKYMAMSSSERASTSMTWSNHE